jgi:hypothetical protein
VDELQSGGTPWASRTFWTPALHNNADRNGIHTNAMGVVGGGRGFLRGDSIGWQPNFPTNVGIGMSNGFAVEAWVNKVNSGGTDGLIGMYHSGGWPFVDSLRINTEARMCHT